MDKKRETRGRGRMKAAEKIMKKSGIRELERRAGSGDGKAAWTLGSAFADGDALWLADGTRKQVRKNTEKAIRWLRLAAALGETDALCHLGCLLTNTGKSEDVAEGILLLKRAWRKGCHMAAQNLAVTYSELDKPRLCVAWLRKACQHEESADWLLLGIAWAAGYGVRKDVGEAVRMFQKVRDDEMGFLSEREDAAGFLSMLEREQPIRVTGSIGRTHPEK